MQFMAVSGNHTATRFNCLYMAKLAEQVRRHDDMFNFMEYLVAEFASAGGDELNANERTLFAVACKNVISPLRDAWLTAVSSANENKGEDHVALIMKDYKSKIESELYDVCARVLKLLESHLIPSASSSESRVFYLKMKGDFHRYSVEFKVGAEREEAIEETMAAYKAAEEIVASVADDHLPPTHPTRLGLALNFSVLYYDILRSHEKARSVAREAFDEANTKLDTLTHNPCKETSLNVMRLLRQNLALWSSRASSYYD